MATALEQPASRVELASGEQTASREGPASDVDELLALRASILSLAQRFDPAGLRPVELAQALRATTVTRNALGTIEALVAKAIKDASAFERGQDRSADHFVSRTLGTSVKNARDLLETAEALQSLPATEAAARRGELSGDQAQAVTKGASADPTAEGRLLDTARRGSLGELKDEARRVRFAAAPDPEARRRRIYEQRSLRTYADDEGAFHLHLTHTAETGAKIKGALDPLIEALLRGGETKGTKGASRGLRGRRPGRGPLRGPRRAAEECPTEVHRPHRPRRAAYADRSEATSSARWSGWDRSAWPPSRSWPWQKTPSGAPS